MEDGINTCGQQGLSTPGGTGKRVSCCIAIKAQLLGAEVADCVRKGKCTKPAKSQKSSLDSCQFCTDNVKLGLQSGNSLVGFVDLDVSSISNDCDVQGTAAANAVVFLQELVFKWVHQGITKLPRKTDVLKKK